MITVKEAAKIISVQPETIRRYIREGLGKDKEKLKTISIMHGRRREYRIKQSDLEDYKNKHLSLDSK